MKLCVKKRLNKITVIPPLFSNFQATWSDGEQIESTGEWGTQEKKTVSLVFQVFDEKKGLKSFLLNSGVKWTVCIYILSSIAFKFQIPHRSVCLKTLPTLQIHKSFPIGHICQSDYSDADWINRTSMAAKSNTLILSAGICQLRGARLNWESNLPNPRIIPYQGLVSHHIYVRETLHWKPGHQGTCGSARTPIHAPTHPYVQKWHRDYGDAAQQQPRPVHTKCLLAAISGTGLVIISL